MALRTLNTSELTLVAGGLLGLPLAAPKADAFALAFTGQGATLVASPAGVFASYRGFGVVTGLGQGGNTLTLFTPGMFSLGDLFPLIDL